MWQILKGFLIGTTGLFVTQLFTLFGVGLISYTLVDEAIELIAEAIRQEFLGGDPFIINILGLMGFGTAFNIIFSAYVTSITVRLACGTLTSIKFKTLDC